MLRGGGYIYRERCANLASEWGSLLEELSINRDI